jgi:hypothetical protein
MTKLESVSQLLKVCKNEAIFGELSTLVELSKNHDSLFWKGGSRHPYDIECDGKRIEVKACNVDNEWAKLQRRRDGSFQSGFDKIYPERFDYLVCVSFDKNFLDSKFYVFSPDNVLLFQKGKWSKFPDAFTLEIRKYDDPKVNKVIEDSSGAWNKIK